MILVKRDLSQIILFDIFKDGFLSPIFWWLDLAIRGLNPRLLVHLLAAHLRHGLHQL